MKNPKMGVLKCENQVNSLKTHLKPLKSTFPDYYKILTGEVKLCEESQNERVKV